MDLRKKNIGFEILRAVTMRSIFVVALLAAFFILISSLAYASNPKSGDYIFLRNVCAFLPYYTALYPTG
jgi:hypothetical protein